MAGGLVHSQARARRDLAERFEARGAVGARFVETFTDQLLDRESLLAGRRLGADPPDETRFSDIVEAFGFQAAVLLDDAGRALHVAPANPSVIGRPIADQYDHLRAAVGGTPTVSNVVPSAARAVPVVAFAAPFDTAHGRRVFSGAYEIADTPLGEFLRNALPVDPHLVYLTDRNGVIVASDPPIEGTQPLRTVDPNLASGLIRQPAGEYRAPDSKRYYFSAHAVRHTPWTLIIAAPTSVLFAPVTGTNRLLPWLILGLLGAVGAVTLGLFVRYVHGRRQLAGLNRELEYISRTDPVTCLYNRRHVEEHLGLTASAARRHGHPLSVLLVDIDHFKTVNDRYGHDVGDLVLRTVAERMSADLRAEDVIGRWGGEEFVVVLAFTSLAGAVTVAERLRAAVAAAPIQAGDVGPVTVTVSVGCAAAAATDSDPTELVRRADSALYQAKAAGRNRVIAGAGAPH
jgi:diguanylate cyclase (GGDEF)-like protein